MQRKSLGLTQTELGAKLGVQKNAVSKWECGRVDDIPSSKIKVMAQLFGVQPSYLIDDEIVELPSPAITKNLTADEANAFFQYLSGMGYFVRYDEERIGYHVISEDHSLDLFLSPEEFKRTARTSSGMIKGMLESMKHQQ